MKNLVTRENILKILESEIMLEQFYSELKRQKNDSDYFKDDNKSSNSIEMAIWYSLRDYHTNLALRQSKGEEDSNPFSNHSNA